MYDQGDQEDKEIAAEQRRAAQQREELINEDNNDGSPSQPRLQKGSNPEMPQPALNRKNPCPTDQGNEN